MICGYTAKNGKRQVFCIEVYNGGENYSSKVAYVCRQLESLFKILDTSKKIENRI